MNGLQDTSDLLQEDEVSTPHQRGILFDFFKKEGLINDEVVDPLDVPDEVSGAPHHPLMDPSHVPQRRASVLRPATGIEPGLMVPDLLLNPAQRLGRSVSDYGNRRQRLCFDCSTDGDIHVDLFKSNDAPAEQTFE